MTQTMTDEEIAAYIREHVFFTKRQYTFRKMFYFMIGIFLGVMIGQAINHYQQVNQIGKHVPHVERVTSFEEERDVGSLITCSQMLKGGMVTHPSQQDACAHFIDEVLTHAGHGDRVQVAADITQEVTEGLEVAEPAPEPEPEPVQPTPDPEPEKKELPKRINMDQPETENGIGISAKFLAPPG